MTREAVTRKLYGWCSGLQERVNPCQDKAIRRLVVLGPPFRKGGEQENSGQGAGSERGLLCLSDVTQQCSLGLRGRQEQLGVFPTASRYGMGFSGECKADKL